MREALEAIAAVPACGNSDPDDMEWGLDIIGAITRRVLRDEPTDWVALRAQFEEWPEPDDEDELLAAYRRVDQLLGINRC